MMFSRINRLPGVGVAERLPRSRSVAVKQGEKSSTTSTKESPKAEASAPKEEKVDDKAAPPPPPPKEEPVAEAPKAAAATSAKRKLSPLQKGGTLKGEAALGKDAGSATKAAQTGDAVLLQMKDGKFVDDRWKDGNWDLSAFATTDKEGNPTTDWDAVIDAEMARRKLLEDNPIASTNEDPVVFDTEQIPWWAWVRRFHLPQAELLNGRACMVGYLLAGIVDVLTGSGLVEQ